MDKIVDAKEDLLINFINNNYKENARNQVYEIPCYQRSFSWVEKHCKTLFNDIFNSYKTNTSYFLGSFIYYEKDGENDSYFLVDGQQRLTSIILMLCALRNKYPELYSVIETDFILTKKRNNNILKLKQNNFDYDIFKKIIEDKISEIVKKNSKLLKAYYVFENLVNEKRIDNPLKFYEAVKNLYIIRIKILKTDTQMIQKLFEKINSTGKELTPSDLIRNYLLTARNSKEQAILYDKWNLVEQIIQHNSLDNFLKSYVVLKLTNDYKVISYDDIYEKFVEVASNKKNITILEELIKYAPYYSFIDEGNLYIINDRGQVEHDQDINKNDKKHNGYRSIRNLVALLRNIGTSELYPFFIQLMEIHCEKENFEELKNILDTFLDFIIRYRITGTSKGGVLLTTAIRKLMDKIKRNNNNATKTYIYKYLSEYKTENVKLYPNNEQFKTKLMDSVDTTNAKVLLYQLERKKDSKGIDVNFVDINLEHVMPQTINDNPKTRTKDDEHWINNLGGVTKYREFHEKYLWSIGNLVILSCSKNKCKKYSNKKWPEKRKLLETDKFLYTKEISTNKKWNQATIKTRNEKFSDKICKEITGPY